MNGVPHKSLHNQERNYIVSNDGLGVTEFNGPSASPIIPSANKPMNQGPTLKTPTLIPPLKYIVYNNPQAAYNFLVNLGYNVKNDIPSTYQFAKNYIRERGEEGVYDIVRAAHPDTDLIFKAFNVKEQDKSSSYDGQAVSTTAVPTTAIEPASTKTTDVKSDGFKLTANSICVILVILIIVMLITRK